MQPKLFIFDIRNLVSGFDTVNILRKTLSHLGIYTSDKEMKTWHSDISGIAGNYIRKNRMEGAPTELLVNDAKYRISNSLIDRINEGSIKYPKTTRLVIESLREKDHKIAIHMGCDAVVADRLVNHLQLRNHVNAYISADRYKPGPYDTFRLMEQCGVKTPSDVVKTVSCSSDVIEGRNAGCGIIIADLSQNRNIVGADFSITNINTLENELAERNIQ